MTREEIIDFCEMKSQLEPENKDIFNYIIKTLEEEPSYNSVNSLAESKLKNPKVKTFDILHFVADNAGLSTFEAIEKAYIMGVSEQEQVLDKIRAEIFNACSDSYYMPIYSLSCDEIFEVIDKYKIESEQKNERI